MRYFAGQSTHMVSKIFKVLWIISLLAAVAVFFYTYASLQEVVNLGVDELPFSRTGFFYGSLAILVLFNGLSFPVRTLVSSDLRLGWFYGLLVCLHLFLSATFIFIGILNSNEKYDYLQLGPAVIGSFSLFCGWILLFPVVLLYERSRLSNQVS